MTKKERRKAAKLQVIADKHNRLVRLRDRLRDVKVTPTSEELGFIEEMRVFLEKTTVFGTIEVMSDLINHPDVEEHFMKNVEFKSELGAGYHLFMHLLRDVGNDPSSYVEDPLATSLRTHASGALRALRENLTIRNIKQSVHIIKLIRSVDALRKTKLDLADLLDLVHSATTHDLVAAAMLINSKSNLPEIIEKLKGEIK